jgi:hypothetical protein
MMDDKLREKYETYQKFMDFLCEYLPAKGYHVATVVPNNDPDPAADEVTYEQHLQGDRRENMVREYLGLPTVQEDRAKADELVKELQLKARMAK